MEADSAASTGASAASRSAACARQPTAVMPSIVIMGLGILAACYRDAHAIAGVAGVGPARRGLRRRAARRARDRGIRRGVRGASLARAAGAARTAARALHAARGVARAGGVRNVPPRAARRLAHEHA